MQTLMNNVCSIICNLIKQYVNYNIMVFVLLDIYPDLWYNIKLHVILNVKF